MLVNGKERTKEVNKEVGNVNYFEVEERKPMESFRYFPVQSKASERRMEAIEKGADRKPGNNFARP